MSVLRCLFLSLFLWPAALAADPIEDVISGQLSEFREGDVLGAWAYASPGIRAYFGSPDTFGHVVEEGFAPIWSNKAARFSDRDETDDRVRQIVVVEGANGQIMAYAYYMFETENGWRIDGVEPVELPDVAV